MPKNPIIVDQIVLTNGGSIKTAGGTDIVSVDSSGSTVNITGTETVVASEIALADGKVLIGNALGKAAANTVSGDGTLSNAGALAVTGIAAGTSTINNSITTSSATPGTIRAIVGANAGTNATMTSGNLVGVRGATTVVGASGGFIYGTQGKAIATGTLSGSVWFTGLYGQLDISAATVNAGQCAAIWGDYGATSGTMTDATGCRGIAMTNTTAAVLNSQLYLYGSATNLLELAGPGGTMAFVTGSNGGGADVYLTISINGVPAKIAAKYVS